MPLWTLPCNSDKYIWYLWEVLLPDYILQALWVCTKKSPKCRAFGGRMENLTISGLSNFIPYFQCKKFKKLTNSLLNLSLLDVIVIYFLWNSKSSEWLRHSKESNVASGEFPYNPLRAFVFAHMLICTIRLVFILLQQSLSTKENHENIFEINYRSTPFFLKKRS